MTTVSVPTWVLVTLGLLIVALLLIVGIVIGRGGAEPQRIPGIFASPTPSPTATSPPRCANGGIEYCTQEIWDVVQMHIEWEWKKERHIDIINFPSFTPAFGWVKDFEFMQIQQRPLSKADKANRYKDTACVQFTHLGNLRPEAGPGYTTGWQQWWVTMLLGTKDNWLDGSKEDDEMKSAYSRWIGSDMAFFPNARLFGKPITQPMGSRTKSRFGTESSFKACLATP